MQTEKGERIRHLERWRKNKKGEHTSLDNSGNKVIHLTVNFKESKRPNLFCNNRKYNVTLYMGRSLS